MQRIIRPAALLFCVLHLAIFTGKAQDVHSSQFYETNVLRNPALTGIATEDYKVGAVYRSQWSAVGNPYQTLTASAEFRFSISRNKNDYFTVAAMAFTDKAGRALLKTNGVYPCINYHKSLADPHNSYLSVGFTAGYLQRSFDPSKLTFDNQYQGGTLLTALGPGEDLPRASLNHWDVGAGISYNSGVGESNNIVYYVGLSAYHFSQPRATFALQSEVLNLATRINGNLGLHATIDEVWSVNIHGNFTFQGSYRETMVGGLIRWAGAGRDEEQAFAFSGGAFYRLSDAIVPTIKVDYKHESFGMSYDINISDLKAATGMRGGLELTAFFNGFFSRERDAQRISPRFQ